MAPLPEAEGDMKSTGLGWQRVVAALGYSRDGIVAAWRTEMAFRQEVFAAIVLIPVACILPVPLLHRALLIASVLLTMLVELINSSIEAIVDLASPDRHPLAKKAKDAGSAAVLFSVLIAILTWSAVLLTWLW
jgi:diacylglycerol kinase (ATP)